MKNLMEQQLWLVKAVFLFGTENGESQLKKHPGHITIIKTACAGEWT